MVRDGYRLPSSATNMVRSRAMDRGREMNEMDKKRVIVDSQTHVVEFEVRRGESVGNVNIGANNANVRRNRNINNPLSTLNPNNLLRIQLQRPIVSAFSFVNHSSTLNSRGTDKILNDLTYYDDIEHRVDFIDVVLSSFGMGENSVLSIGVNETIPFTVKFTCKVEGLYRINIFMRMFEIVNTAVNSQNNNAVLSKEEATFQFFKQCDTPTSTSTSPPLTHHKLSTLSSTNVTSSLLESQSTAIPHLFVGTAMDTNHYNDIISNGIETGKYNRNMRGRDEKSDGSVTEILNGRKSLGFYVRYGYSPLQQQHKGSPPTSSSPPPSTLSSLHIRSPLIVVDDPSILEVSTSSMLSLLHTETYELKWNKPLYMALTFQCIQKGRTMVTVLLNYSPGSKENNGQNENKFTSNMKSSFSFYKICNTTEILEGQKGNFINVGFDDTDPHRIIKDGVTRKEWRSDAVMNPENRVYDDIFTSNYYVSLVIDKEKREAMEEGKGKDKGKGVPLSVAFRRPLVTVFEVSGATNGNNDNSLTSNVVKPADPFLTLRYADSTKMDPSTHSPYINVNENNIILEDSPLYLSLFYQCLPHYTGDIAFIITIPIIPKGEMKWKQWKHCDAETTENNGNVNVRGGNNNVKNVNSSTYTLLPQESVNENWKHIVHALSYHSRPIHPSLKSSIQMNIALFNKQNTYKKRVIQSGVTKSMFSYLPGRENRLFVTGEESISFYLWLQDVEDTKDNEDNEGDNGNDVIVKDKDKHLYHNNTILIFDPPSLISTQNIGNAIVSEFGDSVEMDLIGEKEGENNKDNDITPPHHLFTITFHCHTEGTTLMTMVIPIRSYTYNDNDEATTITQYNTSDLRLSFQKQCKKIENEGDIIHANGGLSLPGFHVGHKPNSSEIVLNGFPLSQYYNQMNKPMEKRTWRVLPSNMVGSVLYISYNKNDMNAYQSIRFGPPQMIVNNGILSPSITGSAEEGGVIFPGQSYSLDLTYNCQYEGMAIMTVLLPIYEPEGVIGFTIPKNCSGPDFARGTLLHGLYIYRRDPFSGERVDLIKDGMIRDANSLDMTVEEEEESTTTLFIEYQCVARNVVCLPFVALDPYVFSQSIVAAPEVNHNIPTVQMTQSKNMQKGDKDSDENENENQNTNENGNTNDDSVASSLLSEIDDIIITSGSTYQINITYNCIDTGLARITLVIPLVPTGVIDLSYIKVCDVDESINELLEMLEREKTEGEGTGRYDDEELRERERERNGEEEEEEDSANGNENSNSNGSKDEDRSWFDNLFGGDNDNNNKNPDGTPRIPLFPFGTPSSKDNTNNNNNNDNGDNPQDDDPTSPPSSSRRNSPWDDVDENDQEPNFDFSNAPDVFQCEMLGTCDTSSSSSSTTANTPTTPSISNQSPNSADTLLSPSHFHISLTDEKNREVINGGRTNERFRLGGGTDSDSSSSTSNIFRVSPYSPSTTFYLSTTASPSLRLGIPIAKVKVVDSTTVPVRVDIRMLSARNTLPILYPNTPRNATETLTISYECITSGINIIRVAIPLLDVAAPMNFLYIKVCPDAEGTDIYGGRGGGRGGIDDGQFDEDGIMGFLLIPRWGIVSYGMVVGIVILMGIVIWAIYVQRKGRGGEAKYDMKSQKYDLVSREGGGGGEEEDEGEGDGHAMDDSSMALVEGKASNDNDLDLDLDLDMEVDTMDPEFDVGRRKK